MDHRDGSRCYKPGYTLALLRTVGLLIPILLPLRYPGLFVCLFVCLFVFTFLSPLLLSFPAVPTVFHQLLSYLTSMFLHLIGEIRWLPVNTSSKLWIDRHRVRRTLLHMKIHKLQYITQILAAQNSECCFSLSSQVYFSFFHFLAMCWLIRLPGKQAPNQWFFF